MNGDQNAVAPDVILGSAVIRIPEAFLSTARRWQAEGVGGAPIHANTQQDVIDFVFNPELIDRVPAEAIERVAATKSAIREGEVDLPRVIVVEGEVEGL